MRALELATLVVAIAIAAPRDAGAPARAQGTPRRVAVGRATVELPASWLACETAADCVWVAAGCSPTRTGVNAQHERDARERLEKACAFHMGTLRGRLEGRPACTGGVCAEAPGAAPTDAGSAP